MFIFNTKEIHNADTPFNVNNCDMVTFHYCKNKVSNTDFTLIKPHVTSIIDLAQPIEEIWHNINSTTCRLINKAKREDIQVRQSTCYDEFYNIYKTLLRQKGYATYQGLFNRFGIGAVIKKTMKQHGSLFTAHYQGEIIAGIIALESKTSIHFWIGANKRFTENKNKQKLASRAFRFLIWNIIKYAKERGIREFDMGGIFSDEEVREDPQKEGIRTFKMQFGGKKVMRYQYQKIYSPLLKMVYPLIKRH